MLVKISKYTGVNITFTFIIKQYEQYSTFIKVIKNYKNKSNINIIMRIFVMLTVNLCIQYYNIVQTKRFM